VTKHSANDRGGYLFRENEAGATQKNLRSIMNGAFTKERRKFNQFVRTFLRVTRSTTGSQIMRLTHDKAPPFQADDLLGGSSRNGC
jgi:hypothetical protein